MTKNYLSSANSRKNLQCLTHCFALSGFMFFTSESCLKGSDENSSKSSSVKEDYEKKLKDAEDKLQKTEEDKKNLFNELEKLKKNSTQASNPVQDLPKPEKLVEDYEKKLKDAEEKLKEAEQDKKNLSNELEKLKQKSPQADNGKLGCLAEKKYFNIIKHDPEIKRNFGLRQNDVNLAETTVLLKSFKNLGLKNEHKIDKFLQDSSTKKNQIIISSDASVQSNKVSKDKIFEPFNPTQDTLCKGSWVVLSDNNLYAVTGNINLNSNAFSGCLQKVVDLMRMALPN